VLKTGKKASGTLKNEKEEKFKNAKRKE